MSLACSASFLLRFFTHIIYSTFFFAQLSLAEHTHAEYVLRDFNLFVDEVKLARPQNACRRRAFFTSNLLIQIEQGDVARL